MSGQEYYLAGIQKFDDKNYEDALRNFTRALLAEPNKTEYLFAKARVNCQLRKYLEALSNFDEALINEPRNAMIHSEKGVALFHLNRLDEALKSMNQAREIEPDNPYRYSSRAYIKAKLGDLFGAVEDYKKAVKLDPQDAVSLNNLGMLEEQMGYQKDAKKHFKKADNVADKTGMNEPFKKVVEEARKNITPISEEEFKELYKKNDSSQKTDNNRQISDNQNNDESKTVIKQIKTEKINPTLTQYWRVILAVFMSKENFEDFKLFVKKLFGITKK